MKRRKGRPCWLWWHSIVLSSNFYTNDQKALAKVANGVCFLVCFFNEGSWSTIHYGITFLVLRCFKTKLLAGRKQVKWSWECTWSWKVGWWVRWRIILHIQPHALLVTSDPHILASKHLLWEPLPTKSSDKQHNLSSSPGSMSIPDPTSLSPLISSCLL